MPRNPLPDFVIIGTQRGGTTSLYEYLVAHPRVAPAAEKETHYLDRRLARGEEWYRSRFAAARRDRPWGRRMLAGEATPYYLFHPHAARRLAELAPKARMIAVLRHPVDRALSHHRHEVHMGHESLPFERAVAVEDERLAGEAERMLADETYRSYAHEHHTYLARGRYAEQLPAWFARFPRGQMLILRSEDLFARPEETYRLALEFLGLPAWAPPAFERHNATEGEGLDAGLRRELVERFRPHNDALRELVGWEPGWDA
jgi:hypothetical protein